MKPPATLPPLALARHPPVIVIGEGIAAVAIGHELYRIDITSDTGTERCARLVSLVELRQLAIGLTALIGSHSR